MDNIKCIILDIDYTLTRSDGSISNYTKEIIRKVIDEKIHVILCTGRPNIYAIEKCKESNSSPIVIANNGAIIYNYENKEIIYKNEISKDILNQVWNLSLKNNVDCVLNAVDTRYRHLKFAESKYIKTNSYINDISELTEHVSQIVLSSKDYTALFNIKKSIDDIEDLEITNTNLYSKKENNYYFCDINKKGNSKGKSIIYLIKYLGVNIDETLCFGDSMNDKSMFDVCKNTVAMKNANENIKDLTKYVTDYTNDEDGVARFIEDNILNVIN